MSLKSVKDFNDGVLQVVARGDVNLYPTPAIDISEMHYVRLMGYVKGSAAGSNGNVKFSVFGKINDWEDLTETDSLTIAANGTAEVMASKLVDIRGFSSVLLKFSYSGVGADTVSVKARAGSPFISFV